MNTFEHFTYDPKPALMTRVANGLIITIAVLVPVLCLSALLGVVTV